MPLIINEFLPNPVGPDAPGEWMELYNNGDAPVSLSGWRIENGAGKKYFFGNRIVNQNSYLVLARAQTKITLRNSDETLGLYDRNNLLVDQAVSMGAAPEGKSWSRQIDGGYSFADATPGAVNARGLVFPKQELAGQIGGRAIGGWDVLGMGLLWGLIMAAGAVYLTRYFNDHKQQII